MRELLHTTLDQFLHIQQEYNGFTWDTRSTLDKEVVLEDEVVELQPLRLGDILGEL